MRLVHAVDSSFDLLTEDEARNLKAAGVDLYIQALSALPVSGLEQPATRVISLRNATHAGLAIAGYALLGRGSPQEAMEFAISGVPLDLLAMLRFVAVDVEVPGITIGSVNAALDRLGILVQGRPEVVYTNHNTWHGMMGSPTRRPGTWLWDANWDNKAELTYPRPYGGWEGPEVIGKQFTGGTHVAGQHVDRNVFNGDAIGLGEFVPPKTELRISDVRKTLEALLDATWV